ncbi:MAG: hypothetical protein ABII09_10705 [Planctomycetota bacterium]
MKGFPNQVSDLETIAGAIRVLGDLNTRGKNPRDDGIFGEELIQQKVLKTGHTDIPIDEYLAQQKTKKRTSDQSFRTRARGLRELFRILGLIEDSGEQVNITPVGQQISSLGDEKLTPEGIRLWRKIIVNMVHDGGDNEISHPYQVLLRLVAKYPGITRAKCALALEAKNDTEDELDRIVGLAKLNEDEIINGIGVTESNWDNAKKILPRFAEQLGDVQKVEHQFFLSDAPGVLKESTEVLKSDISTKGPRKPRSAIAVTAASIAKSGTEEEWDEAESEIAVDPDAIKEQKAKLKGRLRRHNLLVQKLAKELEVENTDLYENPFDCLACFPEEGFLFEVKTLDGTVKDEIIRVREALAQLLYYESFVTRPLVKGRAVKKIACFEEKISDAHIEWLKASDISVIWNAKEGFKGTPEAEEELKGHLGF